MTKTQIENRQIDRYTERTHRRKKALKKRNEKLTMRLLEGCKRKTGKESNWLTYKQTKTPKHKRGNDSRKMSD